MLSLKLAAKSQHMQQQQQDIDRYYPIARYDSDRPQSRSSICKHVLPSSLRMTGPYTDLTVYLSSSFLLGRT